MIKLFMTMQVKLIPQRINMSYEQILVHTRIDATDHWYPTCLVHIDTFFSRNKKELYELLSSGEEVEMEISMEEMK